MNEKRSQKYSQKYDAVRKREYRAQKRNRETIEKQEKRREYDRERKRQKLAIETNQEKEQRNEHRNNLRKMMNQRTVTGQHVEQQNELVMDRSHEIGARDFNRDEKEALRKFRDKVDNFRSYLCPICNEKFPSIVLVNGECRRCYNECSEEGYPKKFSAGNMMDPGEVPEELQGLTEIEEMLIARVFPVMSVYKLRGGQYGYRGNVINFPQNVEEFATRLPRYPSSLNVLLVRRHSANDLGTFKDFKVRRMKVTHALYWLKKNNRYYRDIDIDNEMLQSLPDDGYIGDRLQHVQMNIEDMEEDEESQDDDNDIKITRTFVPMAPLAPSEDSAIKSTLKRMQNKENLMDWPQITDSPINEFQTVGYIACAFPTLYPTGSADLHAERIRKVNPAEYFKHLLLYKDGRFGRHSRWRYFALNSQMRWRALQEGKIYVKQNLNDECITITDIKEKIEGDNHFADRIMRFRVGLRGSCQFWNARRGEVSDMVKQLGSQGLIFFTFSAADLHWPELHRLMSPNENVTEGSESNRQNHQNVVNNPQIVAWFFNKRFETFFNDVLIKCWDLEDWWYRYEWQHRGSVDVHGIGKIQNAPVIEWDQIKEDDNMMDEAIKYIDAIVTTKNPAPNAPIPDKHPCHKDKNDQ